MNDFVKFNNKIFINEFINYNSKTFNNFITQFSNKNIKKIRRRGEAPSDWMRQHPV